MANHSSAKKAIRQTIRKTFVNKNRVSRIRTYVKKVLQEISSGSKESAHIALVLAQSELMKGVTKNVIKLNTASRKISRLSQRIKNMDNTNKDNELSTVVSKTSEKATKNKAVVVKKSKKDSVI
jgi:small subunit ribosomal protein S20